MPEDGVFDEQVARTYDRDHGGTDPDHLKQTVDTLYQLAGDGPVLEFAIGTGRVALPLRDRGVGVQGIDLSKAMLDRLRAKETGTPIDVVIGDMTATRVAEHFSLVYLVFNTIDNLASQAAQSACFRNAAAHLKPGGRFLVEAQIPPIQKVPFGEARRAFALSDDHWGIDEFDSATQNYTSHHVWMRDGALSRLSIPLRYAWPAEMDLMAEMAGLELEHRWEDWKRTPYTGVSTGHVSVWRKPAT